jgi:hypothetical protein
MNPPLVTQFAKSPNPQPGDVYVNQPAENFVLAYWQQQGGLHDLFPPLPVDLQSGTYFEFSRADSLRNQTELKAPAASPAQIGVSVSHPNTYNCKVYEAELSLSPELLANYRVPLAKDQFVAQSLGRAAYLNRELRWISSFFTSGVWTTDATVSVTWDDPSSDPIGDIETGIETILLATGKRPNVLALGYQVWKALKQHPDIIARIGTGSSSNEDPRIVTPKLVAALFGLEEIRIGELVHNTAGAGASISMAFAAGKHALLCYRTKTPSILEHSAGYMFTWRGLIGNDAGLAMRMGIDERTQINWNQIKHAEDFKKVASELGYFFPSCVA